MAKMGRPPSADPRSEVVLVRLSKRQKDALQKHWGTPARGLQALVAAHLNSGPDIVAVPAHDPTPQIVPGEVTIRGHLHRRGMELEPTWQGGSKIKRYACSEPGCEEVLR